MMYKILNDIMPSYLKGTFMKINTLHMPGQIVTLYYLYVALYITLTHLRQEVPHHGIVLTNK